MNRHFLLPVFLLALLAVLPLSAQVHHIRTDKTPAFLFVDSANGNIHLFTAGTDLNYNDTLDVGETPPRWFVIDPISEQIIDSATFDGLFNSFPLRVGVDFTHRLLYLPINRRVRAYDMNTLAFLKDRAIGKYTSALFDPISGVLVLARRAEDFVSPGYIVGIDPIPNDPPTLWKIETGINPNMSASVIDQQSYASALYTLNEGTFGNPNSTLTYSLLNPDIYQSVNGGRLGIGQARSLCRMVWPISACSAPGRFAW